MTWRPITVMTSSATEQQGHGEDQRARERAGGGRQVRSRVRAIGPQVALQAGDRGAHGVEARLPLGDRGVLDGAGAEPVDPIHRRLRVAGLPGVDGAPCRGQVASEVAAVLAPRERVELTSALRASATPA